MKSVQQTFVMDKECKHSVVYKPEAAVKPEDAIASSVYVMRSVLGSPVPRMIQLTLTINDGVQS